MAPFHTFYMGDHRAVYADFCAKLLFSSNTYAIERLRGRGLQLKDPRIVNKYLGRVHEQVAYHNIIDKLQELADIPDSEWDLGDVRNYEKIDNLMLHDIEIVSKYVDSLLLRKDNKQ